jgi:hypothetical protein
MLNENYSTGELSMKLLLPLVTLLFALNAHAENCTDLKGCAKLMYELKGEHYVWDVKAEEAKFSSSPDVELTKENADLVFTSLLDQLGLARLPVGDGKTFRVVRAQLRRELELPVVDASAELRPAFPNTWDWYSMRYHVKNADEVSYLENAYRNRIPREAQIQADENSGLLTVIGSAPVVRQMYETLKAADRPLSVAAKTKQKEREERLFAGFALKH